MSNNNSIWFAVDEDGEFVMPFKPYKYNGQWERHHSCALPKGSIKSITGRTLTWVDEPIEWKPGEETKHICRVCGSEKTYETKAYHCNHCAITTEI